LIAEADEPVDTIAIITIVPLNAAMGVVQEWRAERAMPSLRQKRGRVAGWRYRHPAP
jgi:magnesium-transporting ATPase (P-type)